MGMLFFFFYSVEPRVPKIKVVSAQVKHMFRVSFDSMCIKQRIKESHMCWQSKMRSFMAQNLNFDTLGIIYVSQTACRDKISYFLLFHYLPSVPVEKYFLNSILVADSMSTRRRV